MDAFDILTEKLKSTGMNLSEIDHLLARFLEEEAFEYVDYIVSEIRNKEFAKTSEQLLS